MKAKMLTYRYAHRNTHGKGCIDMLGTGRMRGVVTAVAVVAAVTLSGCALPTANTDAGIALPAYWDMPPSQGAPAVDSQWWHAFGSTELNVLVQTAAQGSFDVSAAMARMRQADALARIAGAPLLPEVDANVLAERYKQIGYSVSNNYSGYLSASYELDLWGKNRAARKAAVDTLAATEDEVDAVLLSLTGDVANTYLQTLALRERTIIAQRDQATGEQIQAFITSQYGAGAATALDVSRQKTLVAQLRQNVAQYRQQANDSRIALAMLLGKSPQAFEIRGTSLEAIVVPIANAGVPSDLLTRRPDIAAAERQLAAADADVVVARAAMLPSVTLTLYGGAGNTQLRNLLDAPIYDLAAGLSAPIFNAGRLKAGRDLAVAQREALLANYRGAIVAATGDVETALNGIDGIALRRQAQQEAVAQAETALALTRSRYRAGGETMLSLLDAQRTLYGAQDVAVQLKLAQSQAAVALYKALGGGWNVPRSISSVVGPILTKPSCVASENAAV